MPHHRLRLPGSPAPWRMRRLRRRKGHAATEGASGAASLASRAGASGAARRASKAGASEAALWTSKAGASGAAQRASKAACVASKAACVAKARRAKRKLRQETARRVSSPPLSSTLPGPDPLAKPLLFQAGDRPRASHYKHIVEGAKSWKRAQLRPKLVRTNFNMPRNWFALIFECSTAANISLHYF